MLSSAFLPGMKKFAGGHGRHELQTTRCSAWKDLAKIASKMRVIPTEGRNLVFELFCGAKISPPAVAPDLIRGSPGSKWQRSGLLC